MTRLPAPEQWVLHAMNDMEVAEMIEEHIDYVVETKDGDVRSVHLPMQFVRHYTTRDDGVLPTVVAIATLPIVLADGGLLALEGTRPPAREFISKSSRRCGPSFRGRRIDRGGGAQGHEVSDRRMARRRRRRLTPASSTFSQCREGRRSTSKMARPSRLMATRLSWRRSNRSSQRRRSN